MAMLKLTRWDDKARDVYISAKFVVAITDDHDTTYVWMSSGRMFSVRETPEEIMAMEAMVKEMNPIFYVPPVAIPDFLERS